MKNMDSDAIGRLLIMMGAVIALAGVAVIVLARVPFLGRLPGDVSFRGDNFSLVFPLATCIVLSVVLTIAINVAIRLFR
jgi:hypothetical protein